MATTTDAIVAWARITGEPVPAVDRDARAMKAAVDGGGERRALWPVGAPGGGKRAAQVELHHLINLYLSLAAPQPSEVVQVVDTLRGWRVVPGTYEVVREIPSLPMDAVTKTLFPDWDGTGETRTETISRPSPTTSDGLTLAEWLEKVIEVIIRHDDATRQKWLEDYARTHLTLNVGAGFGWVTVPVPAPPEAKPGSRCSQTIRFQAPDISPDQADSLGAVERIVRVPLRYLATAADLLADTRAKRSSDIFSPPGDAKASAEPKNENAPDLPGSEADTRQQNQPRDNGNRDTINTPENMAERAISQGRKLSRAGLRDHPMPEARVA